jgi:hypothetical protein
VIQVTLNAEQLTHLIEEDLNSFLSPSLAGRVSWIVQRVNLSETNQLISIDFAGEITAPPAEDGAIEQQ